jgi:hypothetical protein
LNHKSVRIFFESFNLQRWAMGMGMQQRPPPRLRLKESTVLLHPYATFLEYGVLL